MTHFLNPTVNDDGLKRSLYISAGVHLALLLFLYFGLPHLMPPLPVPHNPVPFEIVEVSELTNTRVKDQEEPKPKPPEQPPQPAKPPEAAKPAPTPPQPPTPTPPQPPKPVEQPQPEGLKPAPTPQQKPKPPEPKPVAPTQDFNKLLKNLEAKKPAAPTQEDAKADAKTPPQPAVSAAPTLSTRLTISEEDALRRQISQCWNPPVGARNAEQLIVQIRIAVNPDRTVQSAEIIDKARMATDGFFRAAAESARRAVTNPRCSPLELPADKYQQWKNIDFTFDPRDML